MKRLVVVFATVTLLVTACIGGESVSTVTTVGPVGSSTTVPPSPTSAVEHPEPSRHRIAVESVGGEGAFLDTATGARFVPRGMNYNRFITRYGSAIADDLLTTSHYDPVTVSEDLAAMSALGFNTVRILIDTCLPASGCAGTGPSGRSVNPGYLDNLADFLSIAAEHGMVVIVASNTLPDDSWWVNETARLQTDQFESANNEFLNPEAVPIYVDYWRQLVQGLVDRGARTDVVLGYELRQEHHFHIDYAPLSLTSGTVTTANGETYDMASQADKDRMIDEGLVYWADLLRDEIRAIDPTALVTVGFFTPNSPNQVNGPDETRLVRTSYFLRNAAADFIDLHHYAGNGVDDSDIWENFGIDGVAEKPLILGEHGAFRHWWPNEAAGAASVMALEVEACRVGFDGFLVWAWRGDLSEDLYWATDGDGEVAAVVAPVNRPDPCAYGEFDFISFNRAADATVEASSQIAGFEANKAVDGTATHWNAAERAPQWIELRFDGPIDLVRIDLTIAQSPSGRSVHQLWVRPSGGDLVLLKTFDGVTDDGEVLSFIGPDQLKGIDLVRIVTTDIGDLAPAWREIGLYSKQPGG